MKNIIYIILFVVGSIHANAQNWDYVMSSGEYYYGESGADTEEEADKEALSKLCSMISVHVSSDFVSEYKQKADNDKVSHEEYVRQCIQTYTTSTLTNCERMVVSIGKQKVVRRWIKRSELYHIYEARIAKAKNMVEMANEAMDKNKIGIALQYYYWAYSLISSTQYPSKVKDLQGHILVNWIISQMRYILGDIKATVTRVEHDNVDVSFTYKGKPVSDLDYNYNDGRDECIGKVREGLGNMQMVPGYVGEYYHLRVEYEYKGLSRGDSEMESVLNVIGKRPLPEAQIVLKVKQYALNTDKGKSCMLLSAESSAKPYSEIMSKVLAAIVDKRKTDAYPYFTVEGREMFDRLIGYGNGRLIGNTNLQYYENVDGRVTVRGVPMSFSFKNGKKTTFVEEVVFTFDKKGKISNVAFGLGKEAEDDILKKRVSWKKDVREKLVEFLESYKTAYSLKRLDYIRSIFADDAIIIVGNVARVYSQQRNGDGRLTIKGKNIISSNRYTKDKYIENLTKCFRNNEFINIRFTHSDIQKLDKETNKDVVCVQLAQDYNSSTYADMGYLFLMIDMADTDTPFIKVRTWQPEPDPNFGYYNAGDFYDE